MKAKHTPGPWMREGRFIYALHLHKNALVNRFSCSVTPYVSQGGTYEEAEANARLISAAPELIQALENIWAFLAEDDGDGACSPLYQSAIDRVKAAIAKAKGEDQ